MDQLTIKVPGAPVRAADLAPGVHKVGRSTAADVQIDHPSVSGLHGEIIVGGGDATIRDLGSTNGIMLDGCRVRECRMAPGQTVRLGEVELLFAPQPAPYQVRMALAQPRRRPKTFYKSIPGAFMYPFRRNGLLLLITGTVIFGIFDFIFSLRIAGYLLLGGVVGGLFGAAVTGYLYQFMQSIITSSAMGDDKIPNWPDYDSWWESAFRPYFRLMGLCAACAAPTFFWAITFGVKGAFLLIPLCILGFCYAPMALLAVAMDDSLMGVNPLLVIPAIAHVPWEYLVSCLLFGSLFFLVGEACAMSSLWLPPLVGPIIATFFTLYFAVVQMRLLGLLYYCKKDRFGWHESRQ